MADLLLGALQEPEGASAFASRAFGLMEELFPICRSITGNGVRQTLDIVGREIPLLRTEVPTGTPVFDWEVPREWNIRDAWIADATGRRVVDFQRCNLHVVGYSSPVRERLPLAALRAHLHTLPDQPDLIPYRTSYWREQWGFCLSQRQLDTMPEGEYEAVIDATLADGSLTYAQCLVPGESREEFLVLTHVCHPSLANDNSIGIAVATLLARALLDARPRLSYRFAFVPATIGSISWLAGNESAARALRGGLVIGLLGDPAPLTFKRSRRGRTEVDLIAADVLRNLDPASRVVDYSPYGYDERQLCSPGFDLPVGRLTRSSNGEYAQYHTSGDAPALMDHRAIAQSVQALATILARVDANERLRSLSPLGEPRLGKRGLFRSTGGSAPREFEHALLWLLNMADGTHGVEDIAAASGIARGLIADAAQVLKMAGLLEAADGPVARKAEERT